MAVEEVPQVSFLKLNLFALRYPQKNNNFQQSVTANGPISSSPSKKSVRGKDKKNDGRKSSVEKSLKS